MQYEQFPRNGFRWVWWCWVLGALCSSGCAVEQPPEEVGQAAQALDASREIAITLPLGQEFQRVALSATNTLRVAPGVQLQSTGDDGQLAYTGSADLNIGAGALTRSIWSQGKVVLNSNVRVEGSIRTASTVSAPASAVITGTIEHGISLTPPSKMSWVIQLPSAGSSINVEGGKTRTLAPGSYGSVSVKTGGRLKLAAGKYYLTSLMTEPQSVLDLDTRTGPIFVYLRAGGNFKGTMPYQGDNQSLLVVQLGSEDVIVESPFVGSIVAPNASVRLAPVGTAGHKGSFFAKNLNVEANQPIQFKPFRHFTSLMPPLPFVTCVSRVAPNQYAALFGYDNPQTSSVAIPEGVGNKVSLPGGGSVHPPTSFAPGRQVTAFWVPFTSSVTWTLNGVNAEATTASPGCTSDAYPSPHADPTPIGESAGPVSPSRAKGASYSPEAFIGGGTTLLSSSSNVEAILALAQHASLSTLTPIGMPFKVTITSVRVGTDDAFHTRDLDAEVFINGISAGRHSLYDDDCVWGVQACAYGFWVSPNELYSVGLPSNLEQVTVRVRLFEVDNGGDDVVLDHQFVVNNLTGEGGGGCADGEDSWSACWSSEHNAPPPLIEPRVCATWNTSFVDEGFGEDFVGTPVSGKAYKRYPASFARFAIFLEGPMGRTGAGGFLDAEGCIPTGLLAPEIFLHRAGGQPGDIQNGLNVIFAVDADVLGTPSDTTYRIRSLDAYTGVGYLSTNPGQIPHEAWSVDRSWAVPPPRIDVISDIVSPVTNVAATLGSLLARTDMGYRADDNSTPEDEGRYDVEQGKGCPFPDRNGKIISQSCADGELLQIGTATAPPNAAACVTDDQCPSVQLCYHENDNLPCAVGSDQTDCICKWPDQSRWKYITAHEAGHQVQARGAGSIGNGGYLFTCPPGMTCTGRTIAQTNWLIDPPFVDSLSPMCGCQHVDAANAYHCLQSVERSSDGQTEGFAQFYAARGWNKMFEPDCTFVYYKEFLDTNCHPGSDCTPFSTGGTTLYSNMPPVAVDCANPSKWRNNHCPMSAEAEFGTELDWMQFYYALNAPATGLRFTMDDIFLMYRHACHPPISGSPPYQNPWLCDGDTLQWQDKPDILPPNAQLCSVSNPTCPAGQQCLSPVSVELCGSDSCLCKIPGARGFSRGAELAFANNPQAVDRVKTLGDMFGVSRNLQ